MMKKKKIIIQNVYALYYKSVPLGNEGNSVTLVNRRIAGNIITYLKEITRYFLAHEIMSCP